MLFVDPEFFVFFLVVAAAYWSLSRNEFRKIWLLGVSYLFYAAWDYRFLSLILLSTVVDYTAALKMQAPIGSTLRKKWLVMSLVTNLGVLFSFKYFNFFAQSLNELMARFGIEMGYSTLHIILPVGISFYTFQTLSYTIDVYKGELEPRRNFFDVALFVAFFPQLVAGPIVRASHFLPQLDTARSFNRVPIKACVALFLVGFVKKAVISDNIAPYVDAVFENPMLYDSASIRMGVVLYAVQIYCDFSGYSDMAIALAGGLGYRIPINFASPYLSASLTEFWRRWHISLSSWLRDYLYIPLGGSRGGKWLNLRNVFIIFLVSGFWHGANWTFVIWGGLNALYFVPLLLANRNRRNLDIVAEGRLLPSAREVWGMATTFFLTVNAWIFFRAESLGHAFDYLGGMYSLDLIRIPESARGAILPILLFVVVEWLARGKAEPFRLLGKVAWIRWAAYMLAVFIILFHHRFHEASEFIYFQF